MTLPPLHPALVHLPIAFVLLSFFTDVVARVTQRPGLRHVGLWTLALALVSGALTIAAGYWDLSRAALSAETASYVDVHQKVGWLIVAGLVVLTIWRWRIRQQARRVVTKPYIFAAFLLFALTMFQGWYGSEMVYAHGAGVAAAGQGTEPAAAAQQRLTRVLDALTPGTAVGGPADSRNVEGGTDKP
jgi:uncharacterized membrane protein